MRIAALCLLVLTASAHASPPCKRCTLDVPASYDGDLPLLVVLHGDREHATAAAARWRGAAKVRGWALLALECPTDRAARTAGGNGTSTRDGSSIRSLRSPRRCRSIRRGSTSPAGRAVRPIWGMHAPVWTATFAALVIHGGGHQPGADCPERPLPAYFLVGDRNPLHELVKDLRGWFDGCHEDIVWDLIRGGDHDNEDRALDRKKALAILDWLAERPRTKAAK